MLGEDNCCASTADLSLQRCGRSGRNKETRKRTQEATRGDIKFGLEFIEMLIATLTGREMHEIPCEERIGQRHVGVNTGGGERVPEEVNTLFQRPAVGNTPIDRAGMRAN